MNIVMFERYSKILSIGYSGQRLKSVIAGHSDGTEAIIVNGF